MNRTSKSHRPGVAMIAALMVLIFVGAATACLTGMVWSDGQRTIEQNVQAQLEQLLLAGATDAIQHVASTTPAANDSWTLELPPSLASKPNEVRSSVTQSEPGQLQIAIHATLDKRSADQTLRFTRSGAGWALSAANLDDH